MVKVPEGLSEVHKNLEVKDISFYSITVCCTNENWLKRRLLYPLVFPSTFKEEIKLRNSALTACTHNKDHSARMCQNCICSLENI